ncbi:protein of unknown function [Shewanella benthica]|uniref:Uncharacterized protein n=1 Tax=Shewanella benthica TaxID=43661 RepID=A0A330MBA1_9GAMM|nr:protein of unknown function [Shewanella benthica]
MATPESDIPLVAVLTFASAATSILTGRENVASKTSFAGNGAK